MDGWAKHDMRLELTEWLISSPCKQSQAKRGSVFIRALLSTQASSSVRISLFPLLPTITTATKTSKQQQKQQQQQQPQKQQQQLQK